MKSFEMFLWLFGVLWGIIVPRQLSFHQQFAPPETETERLAHLQRYERIAYAEGANVLAGIDEAGRGCLAGPVIAAAVILPRDWTSPGINDSKQLTPSQRDTLFQIIQSHAVSVGVGVVSAERIDAINILQATYAAMEQAIADLTVTPDYLLLDAVILKNIPIRQRRIIKGDTLSLSIAAASIIAKVTRDHVMFDYDKEFPHYRFAEHKGYGTAAHRRAIAEYGTCPIHRKTFRGVKEYVSADREEFSEKH